MATKEIGYTGLDEWSGQIREDFLREMQGKAAYKRYNEMRLNSPIIAAMLTSIEQAVRSVDWNWISESGEEDPRIEFLDACFQNMTTGFDDHIIEALTMLPFGFSLFEIVYERVGSQMLWRKFAFRGQDTVYKWGIDDRGGMTGFWQQVQQRGRDMVFIPIEKMIVYRTRVEKNNPEGRSILRSAWIPYYYSKNIAMFEAIGVERDLAGMPVITMPPEASTGSGSSTDESIAKKLVRNVRNDEQAGVVMKDGWKFELLSTGGQRSFDTDTIIKRYESRMLMSGLAQFLMLGQDKVGSLALSSDQTDFFNMAVNSTCDIISDTLTKYAVPRLMKLNGYDSEGISLQHSPAGDVDILTVADFLQKVGAKITWLPQDEQWLRSLANLNEIDEDTILAERERKAEEMQNQLMQPSGSPFGRQVDEQRAAVLEFAANPPDESERTKAENRLYRTIKRIFSRQKENVKKGLK
jgi:phage gp29-like protein